MTRESVVFLTGIILFLVPNLGIPEDWKYATYIGLSIILMIVGYMLRHAAFIRRIERSNGELHTDSFVEQKGTTETTSTTV
jgi:hypothetical protein